jgi:hypothetical protein
LSGGKWLSKPRSYWLELLKLLRFLLWLLFIGIIRSSLILQVLCVYNDRSIVGGTLFVKVIDGLWIGVLCDSVGPEVVLISGVYLCIFEQCLETHNIKDSIE